MAYATQQDIIDRYGADALYVAADRDNNDAVDTAAVDRALDDASDEINTYVGKKYQLPLNPVPTVLLRICVDIALYRLSFGLAFTEEKRKRYEDAVRFLEGISTGKASLGFDDGSAATPTAGDAELISNPRQFSRRTMGPLT
jgi:phage gp36-like protein